MGGGSISQPKAADFRYPPLRMFMAPSLIQKFDENSCRDPGHGVHIHMWCNFIWPFTISNVYKLFPWAQLGSLAVRCLMTPSVANCILSLTPHCLLPQYLPLPPPSPISRILVAHLEYVLCHELPVLNSFWRTNKITRYVGYNSFLTLHLHNGVGAKSHIVACWRGEGQ